MHIAANTSNQPTSSSAQKMIISSLPVTVRGMSHQLPPDPDPATGFIALLLPALAPPLLCSFIASGQDRTDKGLRTERSISVGADMYS